MAIALLLALGFAGAFVSGLLGVGGAIVLIPLLLYVPPLFGLPAYPIGHVAGMTMVQVLAASLVGIAAHRRRGHFALGLAVPLAAASGVGAALGGWGSASPSERFMSLLFALLALLAGGLMLVPMPEPVEGEASLGGSRLAFGVAMAGGVGVLSGLIGAGGAFLMSPLMRVGLRLPMRTVIGTSLAIVLASGLLGTIGKALAGQIPWSETVWVVTGALLGAPLGATVSHRLQGKTLQWLLAAAILGSGLRMVWQLMAER